MAEPRERIVPPFDLQGAAPHFYTRRPIHLCTDDKSDDDDGPPNWSTSTE